MYNIQIHLGYSSHCCPSLIRAQVNTVKNILHQYCFLTAEGDAAYAVGLLELTVLTSESLHSDIHCIVS